MNNVLYPDAIDANRQGRFAMSQTGGLMGWILLGTFLILMGVGIIIIDISDVSFTDIVASALFIWLGYKGGGQLLFDVVFGSVRQIEGRGEKYISRSSKSTNYYYSVGGQVLHIPSRRMYDQLNDVDNVRAYYLPRSKTLINLEW